MNALTGCSAALLPMLMVVVAQAEVSLQRESSPWLIRTGVYEARVEADGCLTSVQTAGQEWLAAHVGISRGGYFFQGGVLKLTGLKREKDRVVVAGGAPAEVRYEFEEASIHVRLRNASPEPMVYFLVLAEEVESALDASGQAVRTPLNSAAAEVAFVRGSAKLQLSGCNRLWGPWEGPHQVCEVSLAPGESKDLRLSFAQTAAADRQLLAALWPKPRPPGLAVDSPRQHQVIQRSSVGEGPVLIAGQAPPNAQHVRFRITGHGLDGPLAGDWHSAAIGATLHDFAERLIVPAGGWYKLEVEALEGDQVIASRVVEQFGVGEVFVGAGQSNSTNCGEQRTEQKTGMVSSFGGEKWQLANDPQLGVADGSQGGSFWPAFGDEMYRRYRVPIGVATTGFGGTSVDKWRSDKELFAWMMTRVHQLGPQGFRALLWHQGESDVAMASDEYFAKLSQVIQASRSQAGWHFPWLVAQASYHNPAEPRFESVRSAQARLWNEGIALPGPDTDTLTGENRDLAGKGIHFSPTGLAAHGKMWAECVSKYLDEAGVSRPEIAFKVSPWPEADQLFRRDPRWLGGDDAGSIDLGNGRVAWFFGDSFVAPTTPGERRGSTMVHNSVGLQTGYDPASASFKAFWRDENDKPASFFADAGSEFYWPGGSRIVDGKLVIFFMRAKAAKNALSFESTAWGAALIDNPTESPERWHVQMLDAPPNSWRVLVGSSSLLVEGPRLISCSVASDSHDVFLVSWTAAAVSKGDLSRPEWWCGADRGWVAQDEMTELPPPLFRPGQTEFTLHREPHGGAYLQTQFAAFPKSPVSFRTAPALVGPWSALAPAYAPAEAASTDERLMCYAAKAHLEQRGPGLAITYCTNTFDFAQLFADKALYYPRFLKLTRTDSAE